MFAATAWQLYLVAAIVGTAHGSMQTLLSPLIAEVFGLRAHGSILGATAAAGSVGAILGPSFAGYMFDNTGSYNLPFLICGILAVIAAVLVLLVRHRREAD